MDTYPQRVMNNIIPLSVGKTLPEAFEEWSFTETVKDHEEPCEICQLCDQRDLRYHFEIKNCLNNNVLWIGSECITKFGISVFEGEQKLTPEEAKKKLRRLTMKMQQDFCIKVLEEISANAPDIKALPPALDYYKRNGFLTPKLAFVVVWQLNKHKIEYHPSFFKIDLKGRGHKEQLDQMTADRLQLIKPLLSSSQVKAARDRGMQI